MTNLPRNARILYRSRDPKIIAPPMANQAKFVYQAIVKLGEPASAREISEQTIRDRMGTKQPPERVVRYYLKFLVDLNLIIKETT